MDLLNYFCQMVRVVYTAAAASSVYIVSHPCSNTYFHSAIVYSLPVSRISILSAMVFTLLLIQSKPESTISGKQNASTYMHSNILPALYNSSTLAAQF